MTVLSPRTRLWVFTSFLWVLQAGVIFAMTRMEAVSLFEQYVPSVQYQTGVVIGGVVIGVLVAKSGYTRNNWPLQGIGTLLLQLSYGLFGAATLAYLYTDPPKLFSMVTDVQTESILLGSGLSLILVYTTLTFWFGFSSSREFSTWDAKATLVLLSASIFAVGGYYMTTLYLISLMVAFVAMFMHVLHVIGRTRGERIRSVKHGQRVYAGFVGFPVELALYFVKAIRILL